MKTLFAIAWLILTIGFVSLFVDAIAMRWYPEAFAIFVMILVCLFSSGVFFVGLGF